MKTEIQIKIQKQLRNKIQTLQRIDRITYISICLFSFSIILLLFTCVFIIQNYVIKPENCRDLTHTIHNITITNPENSIILDTTYYSIEKDYMIDLLENDRTNEYTYIPEMFDCDEFGIVLMANLMKVSYRCKYDYRIAIGIIIGYNYINNISHLMNFFIDKNNVIWCVEPQNDTIVFCNSTNLIFEHAIM